MICIYLVTDFIFATELCKHGMYNINLLCSLKRKKNRIKLN